jgi:nucleoside-triphosphatase
MSRPQPTNLLLTGRPGCGKTTMVRRVVEGLGGLRLAGFYTQEIREQGRRLGFEAIGLGGQSSTLAHVNFRSNQRVGRYGVDLGRFESLVREELGKSAEVVDLFVVDEIGKMECFSPVFLELLAKVLDGPVPVLATVAFTGGGVIARVKIRSDVDLLKVSPENRDTLAAELVRRLAPAKSNRG